MHVIKFHFIVFFSFLHLDVCCVGDFFSLHSLFAISLCYFLVEGEAEVEDGHS
jgi:hypothetical protein